MPTGGTRNPAASPTGFWPSHPVTFALSIMLAAVSAGIVVDRYAAAAFLPCAGLLALAAGSSKFRKFPGPAFAPALICLAAGFALGGVRHARVSRIVSPDDLRNWLATGQPRLFELRGILISREDRAPPGPHDRPSSELIVRSMAVAGQGRWVESSGDVRLQVITEVARECRVGHAVTVSGWLEPVPDALNPGERSPRKYWNARGVVAQADLRSRGIIGPDPATPAVRWRVWREYVRGAARGAIRGSVSEPNVGLVESIVLGVRDRLSTDDREAFRDTGTIHLLAISGLHLQAVALFVLLVSRRIGIRPEIASIGVVGFTCIYALIVTGGASVLRATVMALAMASSTVRRRPGDFRHRFVLAGLIVLVVNPGDLFDPGAQLSFLGTIALVAASRYGTRFVAETAAGGFDPWFDSADVTRPGSVGIWNVARGMRAIRVFSFVALQWLAASMVVSALVWAITAPLVAFHFSAVNPVAILVNLPLVPLTSFALIAGLSGLALSPLGLTWLAVPSLAASGHAMHYCVGSLDWSLRHGSGPWPLDSLTVFGVAGFYALGFAAWMSPLPYLLPVRLMRLASVLPPAFLVATCTATNLWYSRPPEFLEVEMLAVDHGLAVLVRWPDGQNWLYDCGRMGQPAVGRNIVAPALRSRGVHRLHSVFVSHADADHYNGLEAMIDAGIRVDRLVSSARFFASTQPDTVALFEFLQNRRIPFETVAAGDRLKLDQHGSAQVLLPDADSKLARGSDNAESLVIAIESGGFRLFLTGDLEDDGLYRFVERHAGLPAADSFEILTAPHHGGLSSNPAWLYEAVRPGLVLSSQAKNRFGLSSGLQSAIDEFCPGAALFTTATDGAIRLRWSADALFVSGYAPGSISTRWPAARPASERGRSGTAEMLLDP